MGGRCSLLSLGYGLYGGKEKVCFHEGTPGGLEKGSKSVSQETEKETQIIRFSVR
jgi:hypothetical protein